MIKTTLIILIAIAFSGCVNKRGISTKYYSECKEYYDLQGFYHKDCDDEAITYKEMKNLLKKKKKEPSGNVW